jgi:GAF domain-containing protein
MLELACHDECKAFPAGLARDEPVYANDITTDPLWADYRDLALEHCLRACWSTPIKGADGAVLGTFAIYYNASRAPTVEDIEAIAFITQTAALAIERTVRTADGRRGARLQQSSDADHR